MEKTNSKLLSTQERLLVRILDWYINVEKLELFVKKI